MKRTRTRSLHTYAVARAALTPEGSLTKPVRYPDGRLIPIATAAKPQRQPDLKTEEILFRLYEREKIRADRYCSDLMALRADMKQKKAWARLGRLTKLKISDAGTDSKKPGKVSKAQQKIIDAEEERDGTTLTMVRDLLAI